MGSASPHSVRRSCFLDWRCCSALRLSSANRTSCICRMEATPILILARWSDGSPQSRDPVFCWLALEASWYFDHIGGDCHEEQIAQPVAGPDRRRLWCSRSRGDIRRSSVFRRLRVGSTLGVVSQETYMPCPYCKHTFSLTWRGYFSGWKNYYACPRCSRASRLDWPAVYFAFFGACAIFALAIARVISAYMFARGYHSADARLARIAFYAGFVALVTLLDRWFDSNVRRLRKP